VNYKALSEAVERIWSKSDEISKELDEKFEARERDYIQETTDTRPSGREMKQAFNL
jgi:hypothetical protein